MNSIKQYGERGGGEATPVRRGAVGGVSNDTGTVIKYEARQIQYSLTEKQKQKLDGMGWTGRFVG